MKAEGEAPVLTASDRPPGMLADLTHEDLNDGSCWGCGGGGDMICCDGCRSIWHTGCVGLEEVPEDDFFCPLCCCCACGLSCKGPRVDLDSQPELLPVVPADMQRYCKPGKLPKEHGYVSPVVVRAWLRRGGHRPLPRAGSGGALGGGLGLRQLGARGSGGGGGGGGGGSAGGGDDATTEDEGGGGGGGGGDDEEGESARQAAAPPTWQTLTSVDAFVALLARCKSEEAVVTKLARVFPKSQGQPRRLQPLKALLPMLVPGMVWKDRLSAIRALAAPLFAMAEKKRPEGWDPNAPSEEEEEGEEGGGEGEGEGKAGSKRSADDDDAGNAAKRNKRGPPRAAAFRGMPGARVSCACCQRSCHVACLDAGQQARVYEEGLPYLCSDHCVSISRQMAHLCTLGLMQVDALNDGTPVSWQLIQPAALKAEADAPLASSTGFAPDYPPEDVPALQQVLRDALALLHAELGAVPDVRTHQEGLPWLVAGLRHRSEAGVLDLSHMHVAVLWVGATVAAAALVRAYGRSLLEMPLVATARHLRRRRLGKLLQRCVEKWANGQGKIPTSVMPLLTSAAPPAVGVSLALPRGADAPPRQPLDLSGADASPAVEALRLSALPPTSSSSAPSSRAGGGRGEGVKGEPGIQGGAEAAATGKAEAGGGGEEEEEEMPPWPQVLGYQAPGPSEAGLIAQYPIVRFAYVPFVTKRLTKWSTVPQVSLPTPAGRAPSVMPRAMSLGGGGGGASLPLPCGEGGGGGAGPGVTAQLPPRPHPPARHHHLSAGGAAARGGGGLDDDDDRLPPAAAATRGGDAGGGGGGGASKEDISKAMDSLRGLMGGGGAGGLGGLLGWAGAPPPAPPPPAPLPPAQQSMAQLQQLAAAMSARPAPAGAPAPAATAALLASLGAAGAGVPPGSQVTYIQTSQGIVPLVLPAVTLQQLQLQQQQQQQQQQQLARLLAQPQAAAAAAAPPAQQQQPPPPS